MTCSWRTAPMGFHWPENFNTVPLLEKVRRRDNEEQKRKEVLDVVVSFLARVVRRRYHATLDRCILY